MSDGARSESGRSLSDLTPQRLKSRWRVVRDVASLGRRLSELEAEMQECRRLNRRLAELLDVVEELLVPLSQRDEEKVREYLERYASSL